MREESLITGFSMWIYYFYLYHISKCHNINANQLQHISESCFIFWHISTVHDIVLHNKIIILIHKLCADNLSL